MTDSSLSSRHEMITQAILKAQQWLGRQRADNGEAMLDEGDCRLCGSAAGEGHEPTDPCGIVAALLAAVTAEAHAQPRHEQE